MRILISVLVAGLLLWGVLLRILDAGVVLR